MLQNNGLGLGCHTQQLGSVQQLLTNCVADRFPHWGNEQVTDGGLHVGDLVELKGELNRVTESGTGVHSRLLEVEGAVFLHTSESVGQLLVSINELGQTCLSIFNGCRLVAEHSQGDGSLTIGSGFSGLAHTLVECISQQLGHLGSDTTSTRTVNGNGQWILRNASFHFEHSVALSVLAEAQVTTKELVHQVQHGVHLLSAATVLCSQILTQAFHTIHHGSGGCLVKVGAIHKLTVGVGSLTRTVDEQATLRHVGDPVGCKQASGEQLHCVDWAVGHTVGFNVNSCPHIGPVSHVFHTTVFNQSMERHWSQAVPSSFESVDHTVHNSII